MIYVWYICALVWNVVWFILCRILALMIFWRVWIIHKNELRLILKILKEHNQKRYKLIKIVETKMEQKKYITIVWPVMSSTSYGPSISITNSVELLSRSLVGCTCFAKKKERHVVKKPGGKSIKWFEILTLA